MSSECVSISSIDLWPYLIVSMGVALWQKLSKAIEADKSHAYSFSSLLVVSTSTRQVVEDDQKLTGSSLSLTTLKAGGRTNSGIP